MMKLAYVFNSTAVVLDSIKKYDEDSKHANTEYKQEVQRQFDNAIDAYKKVKSLFSNSIGVNPEIALVFHNKGYYLGNLEKYEEAKAKDCFNMAKALFEDYFQVRGVKGKEEYKTDYANVLRNIGFTCFKLDNHTEARKHFEMATLEDPSFALAWNSKGYHIILSYGELREITSKREDDLKREAISYFEEAIECFQKKGERDLNIAYAYYNKGYAHFLLKEYKDAVQCFEDATKVKPTYADASNGKGVCTYLLHSDNKSMSFTELIKIKKYFDEAISSYTENDVIDRYGNPTNDLENLSYTFYNKAILLKELGRYELGVMV